MINAQNPLTHSLHSKWEFEIKQVFKELDTPNASVFLLLRNFFNDCPQRFYSTKAYDEYLTFLKKTKIDYPDLLAELLIDHNKELGLGYRMLSEINKSDIHNHTYDADDSDLLILIDQKIHFGLLQILESSYYLPLLLFEKFNRKRLGQGIEKIDLFNIMEGHLKKSTLSFLSEPYNNTIRNGIAHGNYYYRDQEIEYVDKRTKVVRSSYEIIRNFDDFVDFTNGMYLALIIFLLSNSDFIKEYKIDMPMNIIIEELICRTNSPFWEIHSCLESVNINQSKQFTLYAKTKTPTYDLVQFSAFQSALFFEKHINNIDKICVNISSDTKYKVRGLFIFNAKKIQLFRDSNYTNLNYLKDIIEPPIFFSKIKYSKLFRKIEVLYMSFKIQKQVHFEKNAQKPYFIRYNNIYIKEKTCDVVIADAKIILNKYVVKDYEDFIRNNYKILINDTIRDAKKSCKITSLAKYFPVKYIRILVYSSEVRNASVNSRQHLIASILVNTSKYIPTIDMIGTVEINGHYRVSWNK